MAKVARNVVADLVLCEERASPGGAVGANKIGRTEERKCTHARAEKNTKPLNAISTQNQILLTK